MRAEKEIPNRLPTEKEPCVIIENDALNALSQLPGNIFQCCVTSPPYWGLRDYGINNQIGAEMSVNDYIKKLVAVFREVYRVLSPDGTLWLNIGDSYTSGGRTWRQADRKYPVREMSYRAPTPEGLKPKDLIGVPWRLAFALQADGWHLRSDIIWYKPNCFPESVKDRPTQSHEYLFLMSKSERYYYDYEAIKELTEDKNGLRNKRSVWSVKTEPFKGAHFAVFPPSLVKPCILAGSKTDSLVLDPFFGSGTVGEVCVQLNRRCVGIELNPAYTKIARDRIAHTMRHS
jgi:site-specific DNA-methyltransferase (cytosine-N4-specific)